MSLTRIKLERFTAFEQLDVELSPGINIFIGENGTGKTHLLKVAYAACDITKTKASFAAKLIRTFLPYQRRIGRLVHRTGKSSRAAVEIYRGGTKLRISFSNHATEPSSARITGKDGWTAAEIESAYIPVKEMLANAPGFLSLYELREIEFEEIYRDIILRAFRDILRGPHNDWRRNLLRIIQTDIQGKVIRKEETFFLRNKQGNLEFTLLAEGMRKLALLWLLIQNGTLLDGSVLFWDEPEANLNPKKMGTLVEILLELQRMGVQILLATHDYVLLKEFDLRMKAGDRVRFHSLYRDDHGTVRHHATEDFLHMHPNAISGTFADLYERDVQRALESK
ncbi:MAG: AAA family ATPase [Deltaproteobacteria bacterium]|nr:MAG: AAA family ATPase [Deltaproteobacteria bacterium]